MFDPSTSVCAVVVVYQPKLNILKLQLDLLVPQVATVVLVNNGCSESLSSWVAKQCFSSVPVIVGSGSNVGIAAAQNIGVAHCKLLGATHVVFFDQDSQPSENLVSILFEAALDLKRKSVLVGAVAPQYSDSNSGVYSGFARLGLLGHRKIIFDANESCVEADFFISSGMLIPVSTIDLVGGADESLFIDHVDTEWCFRARSLGYRLFGVPEAKLVHCLGSFRQRVWFLRWRSVPYHAPFRYYYMFRNALLLMQRDYVPLRWKVSEVGRCFRAFIFFSLFSKNRLKCIKEMCRGVVDGVNSVSGKGVS
jgi:rhamnosyltransferase